MRFKETSFRQTPSVPYSVEWTKKRPALENDPRGSRRRVQMYSGFHSVWLLIMRAWLDAAASASVLQGPDVPHAYTSGQMYNQGVFGALSPVVTKRRTDAVVVCIEGVPISHL